MAESKHYPDPGLRTPPADPDLQNLAAAIKAAYEVLQPLPSERVKFETRLLGGGNGVG